MANGLSRQTRLSLLLLALSPLCYVGAERFAAEEDTVENPAYYLECQKCRTRYPCGPQGNPRMHCHRCAPAESSMVFQARPRTAFWDMFSKILVGFVAYLSFMGLLLGGGRSHKREQLKEKPATLPQPPAAPTIEAPELAVEADPMTQAEVTIWARELLEERRQRFQRRG